MEEEPTSITASGRLVRLFVGGLPLGLLILGALSFVFYFQKKNAPVAASSQLAAMLQKEINTEDFTRQTQTLSQDIGVRNLLHHENLKTTASFVESTLGFDNMGYHVKRQEYGVAGQMLANLVVELTGKVKPAEAVVVMATYDSTEMNLPPEAAGLAALFRIAHAMTGTVPDITVRFAAVANVKAKDPNENGCFVLAREIAAEGQVVTHVIALSPHMLQDATPPEWNKAVVETLTVGDDTRDQTTLLARLNAIKARVEQLSDVR